jgi:EAL domain-containing protein (putative c-di-GMP-specific phosphodiesterase class I)
VLNQAATVVAGLDGRPMNLWINASVLDLRQPGMVDEVMAELNRVGMPPSRLALEVTETALMTDESACLANLEHLVSLGVGVAMDDFGAGFSSLDRLRRLPINALKISGSLLSGAPDNAAGPPHQCRGGRHFPGCSQPGPFDGADAGGRGRGKPGRA